MGSRPPFGCLGIGLVLLFVMLLPLLLAEVAMHALAQLGVSPRLSLLLIMGVVFGSMINIPLQRIERGEQVEVVPVGMFGLGQIFPRLVRRRTYTIIAVNLGGCLVPCGLALYELLRLGAMGTGPLAAALVAIGVNVAVCHAISRPVPNVGIAMHPLLPAIMAALCAIFLLPDFAPPVAFAAGVLGPLIGGDLLHLKQVMRTHTGVASIGGAGTFDGIVISGVVATLLA